MDVAAISHDHLFEKELFIRFTLRVFRLSICFFPSYSIYVHFVNSVLCVCVLSISRSLSLGEKERFQMSLFVKKQ